MNKIYDYSRYRKRQITIFTGKKHNNMSLIGYTERLFTESISNNSAKKPKMSKYISTGTYTSDPGWNRYRAGKFHLYNMKNHSTKSMSDYSDI